MGMAGTVKTLIFHRFFKVFRYSGVFGALGREFSGKLRARCAKLGQDGSKLRPRWATMASRWPSWSQLWRLWCHLGRNLDDFGGVGGAFWKCFCTWLGQ